MCSLQPNSWEDTGLNLCSSEFQAGLEIHLQDENSKAVKGALITSTRWTDSFFEDSQGIYTGLGEGKGWYFFTIKKSGFRTHKGLVFLTRNECHVNTQTKTVILRAEQPTK